MGLSVKRFNCCGLGFTSKTSLTAKKRNLFNSLWVFKLCYLFSLINNTYDTVLLIKNAFILKL